MPIKIDQKYGNLKIKDIINSKKIICLCDCGNVCYKSERQITRSNVKNCGCLSKRTIIRNEKIKAICGIKFNFITVLKEVIQPKHLKYQQGVLYFLCRCDCGKEIIIDISTIKVAKQVSCGCKTNILEDKNKYIIKSAEAVFYRYKDTDLNFDEFFKLSQQNCYYCQKPPSNKSNVFKQTQQNLERRNNGWYIYNGLDRINSMLDHSKNNIVVSCKICNWMKGTLSQDMFFKHINNIYNCRINYSQKNYENINLLFINVNNYQIGSAKKVYSLYNDGNLTLNDFIALSQKRCYYCNKLPSNISKAYRARKWTSINAIEQCPFTYNGLDRLNPNLPHLKENIVTSCRICNTMKLNYSLESFLNHIKKIYDVHF